MKDPACSENNLQQAGFVMLKAHDAGIAEIIAPPSPATSQLLVETVQ